MMSLMICWDEMDPASDTITTSSSDDEQGDYSRYNESILDQCVSNDVTSIVLYSSSSDKELTD